MCGRARTLGILQLAIAALCAAAAGAADPKPATNDFILRAPAAEVAGIASRNGLTLVGELDTPTDPQGRSVYLVRADPSALPEGVIDDVSSLEPSAAGIEEVFLASLPELDQSGMIILDGTTIASALGGVHGFAPPSATVDATWNAHHHDREIKSGKTEDLTFEFESSADTDPAGYALQMDFDSGEAQTSQSLSISGNQVIWEITNLGDADLLLDAATLSWPAGNGRLLGAELHDDSLLDEPYKAFGENPDGSDRLVWQAYLNQPAARQLEVDEAQDDFKGEATVAIIDTGIDPDHPLLAERIVPGYDFINDVAGFASETADIDQSGMIILDQSGMIILDGDHLVPLNQSGMIILDDQQESDLDLSALPAAFGHGTMVAGIVHRVAPEARIMPLKAFDANGHGNLFHIVEAIYFAVANGANVINMSFSLSTYSPELMRAVNYAARNGVTCIASAGNSGEETLVFPASFGNTVGVAATNEVGELSSFSNWGSDLVTIAAPGENILTAFPGGGWALASGTSFAAPWISGAAAIFADKLGKKHDPGKADFYLSSNALSDADDIAGSGDGKCGYGRANLRRAVDRVKSGHYADDRPLGSYTLSANFAEGCTATYPPPGGGAGCIAEGAGQLRFESKKVLWTLENESEMEITLEGLTLDWSAENGSLKKIKANGETIDDVEHPGSSTSISSGWEGDVADRTLAPHESLELVLEFDDDALWTY